MRVGYASYQAISLLHGGPNTQLRSTIAHLPKEGITPVLFDPWAPCKKESFDLFHIFAANIGTYHLAREIHTLGIPLVVTPILFSLHSPDFLRRTLRVTRMVQRIGKGVWSDYALTADICDWASLLLPNTHSEARLVTEGLRVDPAKVHVVPNGVDERFMHGDPELFKKKYGLDRFILNVGHIGHERKNVLALIKALAKVDHPAVIIGRVIDSEYGRECVQEAARHKHILLIDGLDNSSEMLASAYAACDVFVLPSMFETPGIAALEAGLAGAKIVITKHGGTAEYFGDMADYVEPSSVESIREKILFALARKRDGRLIEHLRKEFLWQRVAQKTADVYRRISTSET